MAAGFLARFWARHVMDRVSYQRVMPENRAFQGEKLHANSVINVLYDWDLATNRVECSDNAREFWGIEVGQAEDFIAVVSPEDQPRLADAAAAAAAAVVLEPGSPGLEVVDVLARTDVATADHMTWDVTDLGFKIPRRSMGLGGGPADLCDDPNEKGKVLDGVAMLGGVGPGGEEAGFERNDAIGFHGDEWPGTTHHRWESRRVIRAARPAPAPGRSTPCARGRDTRRPPAASRERPDPRA